MKTLKSFLALTTALLFIQSCGDKSTKVNEPTADKLTSSIGTKSWEFIGNSKDTVNKTDVAGNKQGRWIVLNRFSNPNKLRPIEEGNYTDNKKQGSWQFYDSTGNVNRTVEYKDDIPIKN